MEDRDFFDLLYTQWTKTSYAENGYWFSEKSYCNDQFDLKVKLADDTTYRLALHMSEEDADFVAGVHGCFGDLVRRLHAALDEADRLDRERDETEQNVYALAVENDELRQQIETLRSKAGDVLWKIERPM